MVNFPVWKSKCMLWNKIFSLYCRMMFPQVLIKTHPKILKQLCHTRPHLSLGSWDHKQKETCSIKNKRRGWSQVLALTSTSSEITWHDTASWFIFRQNQFPQTWARTGTQKADIVCYLHQTASGSVHGSTEFNQSIMSSQSFKFVWSCNKRQA